MPGIKIVAQRRAMIRRLRDADRFAPLDAQIFRSETQARLSRDPAPRSIISPVSEASPARPGGS